MKNFLTTTILVLFSGFILCSISNAKVLPIIEGSDLLDSLVSDINEELTIPDLHAGIYKSVALKHQLKPQNNFLKEKLKSMNKCPGCYSIIYESFYSHFYLKPYNRLGFIRQIATQNYLENI